MDIYPYFQDNTSFKFPSSTHTHTHTHKLYIYLHIIMHVSTRTCYIHHKRGVTEFWCMAHFWMSYGRCTYLDHLWDGQKDFLDVGQVRCFHEEASRKLLFWKGDTDDFNAKTKGSGRISSKKNLVYLQP